MRTKEEILEVLRRMPIRPPRVKPTLELVASREREPDENAKVKSIALEPEYVAIVRYVLAGKSVMIVEDEVGFDKITEARVTLRYAGGNK